MKPLAVLRRNGRTVLPARVAGLLLAAMALFGAGGGFNPAAATERIDGPVVADVVEIIDGDSVRVSAHIWPGQRVSVNVRLRGIDAPELRAGCVVEQRLAMAAREALRSRLGGGPVRLSNISGGKYYGRVLADIRLGDGSDLAAYLLDNGLVRVYRGGRRDGWCR
jgi:micrococcal nuclease